MVDTHALGACVERRAGSSPVSHKCCIPQPVRGVESVRVLALSWMDKQSNPIEEVPRGYSCRVLALSYKAT